MSRFLHGLCTAAIATLVLAVSAGLAAPAGAQARDLLWRGDFDSCDFSQWQSVQQATKARARIARSHTSSSGGCSARIETQPNDWTAEGQRTELFARGGPDYPDGQEGAERFYGWSVLFRSDEFPLYLPGPGYRFDQRRNTIMQLKRAGTGPPPISLAVEGDAWRLNAASCDNKRHDDLYRAPLVRDAWQHFVLRVKNSPDPAVGFVELWHNGRLVLPRTHVATMHVVDPALAATDPAACTSPGRRLQPNYLKIGMYRMPRTSVTQALYNDGMRVGKSYEAVEQGASTPPSQQRIVSFPRTCTRGRAIRIRVIAPPQTRLRSVRTTLDRRPVRVRKVQGLRRATLDLRGRSRSRNLVRLRLLTTDGKVYFRKRTYRACGTKRAASA